MEWRDCLGKISLIQLNRFTQIKSENERLKSKSKEFTNCHTLCRLSIINIHFQKQIGY
jgi:hypothetical protein